MNDACHGLLVLDKPGGMTSRTALDRAQHWFPRGTALGHTGTLDPLATGVLVVCVGCATRLAEYVQQMSKTYHARFCLGATSDTDDADGTITTQDVTQPPTRARVEAALREFVGTVEQVPPAYSAAKVTGRRAYALARRGHAPQLAARRVTIHEIDLLACEFPRLDLRIHCSKGTYVRSLARDLGTRLGCGGFVAALRREHVGPFSVEEALSLEGSTAEALAQLRPPSAAVAELPRLALTADEITRLRHGQRIPRPHEQGVFAVMDDHGALVAIARAEGGVVAPEKVLP